MRTRTRAKSLEFRTSNQPELAVAAALERAGYAVIKNGWPDFLAYNRDEVRFIEVKPAMSYHLSARQERMAMQLARVGIKVELLAPDMPEMFALLDVPQLSDIR